MLHIPKKDFSGFYLYPCTVAVGEQVLLEFPDSGMKTKDAYIRAIIFSNMKVRFSVFLKNEKTTLHNIDSGWITKIYDPKFIDFDDDNYS